MRTQLMSEAIALAGVAFAVAGSVLLLLAGASHTVSPGDLNEAVSNLGIARPTPIVATLTFAEITVPLGVAAAVALRSSRMLAVFMLATAALYGAFAFASNLLSQYQGDCACGLPGNQTTRSSTVRGVGIGLGSAAGAVVLAMEPETLAVVAEPGALVGLAMLPLLLDLGWTDVFEREDTAWIR